MSTSPGLLRGILFGLRPDLWKGRRFVLLDVTGGSARAVMTLLGKDVEVELEQEFLAAAQ